MKTCIIVICGHGIRDPLVSTLMLDYAFRLKKKSPANKMLFVTEEPQNLDLPESMSEKLASAGITWFPLQYKVDGRQILQKSWNIVRLVCKSVHFAHGYKHKVLIGFLSGAGAYGSVLRSIGFNRFILVNFEPHSQYMLEMGIWRKGAVKTRIAQWFERRQILNADVLIAPSTAVLEHVRTSGSRALKRMQGVTIDVESNLRNPKDGNRVRRELRLGGMKVLAYIGKFNGLYHSEAQYSRFMVDTCNLDPRIHHLIITFAEHATELERLCRLAGLEGRYTLLGPIAPEKVAGYLSSADFGVIAVPPTAAQRFRSPVKTALYWAAGLPIIIAEGVSDDWRIAKERDIGIVVKDLIDFDKSEFCHALGQLSGINAGSVRQRCMQAAMDLRDSGRMVELLEQAISGIWNEQASQGS